MDFDLATGHVVFKGDVSQLEEDIAESLRKSAKLKKAIEDDGFRFKLYGIKVANDEMNKLHNRVRKIMNQEIGVSYSKSQQNMQERDENWLVRDQKRQEREKAWLDKKGQMEARNAQRALIRAQNMQERDENWLARRDRIETINQQKKRREALQQFGRGAMIVGGAGAAAGGAALGAATSASTLAADTLKKSFELFSVTVGTTFLPLVYEMSSALQNASKWWEGLNATFKESVVGTAKMAAITGVATLAFAALGKALLFISKNPLVVGLAALTGFAINSTMRDNRAAVDRPGGVPDPGPGGIDEKARLREGRKWHEPDNPRLADGKIGRWENGKAVPFKEEPKKRDDLKLGSAGPASFVAVNELLRSIQLTAAGSSPLDAQLQANKYLANIQAATQGMASKMGIQVVN